MSNPEKTIKIANLALIVSVVFYGLVGFAIYHLVKVLF